VSFSPDLSRHALKALILPAIVLVAACGGGTGSESGGSSSSSSSSGSSSGSSSSAGACNYTDLVSASERQQANACGIQVSGNYAQADSGLKSVIAACQQGQKTTADNYYNDTYKKMVDYARSVSKGLSCGTSTAPTLPNTSSQTYYNFCAVSKAVNGKLSYSGACYGPVKQGEGGCGSGYNLYVSQYKDLATCQSQGQAWLNSRP
jgi:hypothetical protein